MKTCVPTGKILFILILTTSLSSCVGYRLNGTTPHQISSVQIAPIINLTDEPAIERHIARAIRSYIQFDGRPQLVDITTLMLELKLQSMHTKTIPLPTAPKIARSHPLLSSTITATARLINPSLENLQEANNYGESAFEFEFDLSTSKRTIHSQ